MRFFVFFLICEEMNEAGLALATSAAATFMEGKPLNVDTILRAGMNLAKTLQVSGVQPEVICKVLDMLLTEALAKVGESNGTEATMLAECKKCVETVLPVVLGHLSQDSADSAVAAGSAAAAAAAAPVVAQAEAAASAAASVAASAAVSAGVPVAVVEKVKAEAEAAASAAVASAMTAVRSGFFGFSCIGCAGLPVEVPGAAAPAPVAVPAAVAAPAEPPKESTQQTPPKESVTQEAAPEPQTAAPPEADPAAAPAAPAAPAAEPSS